ADLCHHFDVGPVFIREAVGRDAAAPSIDALVVGRRTALLDDGVHGLPIDALHPQYDFAVVEQQFVARRAVLDQARVVDADDTFIALLGRVRVAQGKGLACREGNGLVAETGDAYLRPLQVSHDGDVTAVLGRQGAHLAHALPM